MLVILGVVKNQLSAILVLCLFVVITSLGSARAEVTHQLPEHNAPISLDFPVISLSGLFAVFENFYGISIADMDKLMDAQFDVQIVVKDIPIGELVRGSLDCFGYSVVRTEGRNYQLLDGSPAGEELQQCLNNRIQGGEIKPQLKVIFHSLDIKPLT